MKFSLELPTIHKSMSFTDLRSSCINHLKAIVAAAQVYYGWMGAVWSHSEGLAGQGALSWPHLRAAAGWLPVWSSSVDTCLRVVFFYFILSIHFFAKTMTNLEPLKSAISFLAVEDTSLALPSSNQYRSGQQRVLEQVQTMRMHKSRHSSHGSGSPTSKKRNLVSQFCSAMLCI